MIKKKFIFYFLIVGLIPFISAGLGTGVSGIIGVDLTPEPVIFNNATAFVNMSDYWVTNIGILGTVNDTQFDNNAGELSIDTSWLDSFGDGTWLLIDGSNANTDIDIGNYDFYAKKGFFEFDLELSGNGNQDFLISTETPTSLSRITLKETDEQFTRLTFFGGKYAGTQAGIAKSNLTLLMSEVKDDDGGMMIGTKFENPLYFITDNIIRMWINKSGNTWFNGSIDLNGNLDLGGNNITNTGSYFVGDSLLNSTHIIDHGTHSIKDTFNHIINRGVSETITVSLTGGLDVEWTAGEVYDSSIEDFVKTDAGSGTLTNDQVNYLKYTGTSTLELQTSSSSGNEILVARFASINGMIAGKREISLLDNILSDTSRGLRIAFPNRIISGMSISEDTDVTNSLDVSMDAGKIVKDGINEVNPPAIDSRTLPLVRLFHSGGDWTNDSNAEIDTLQYDNGNDLANIPANKWTKGYFIYIQGKLGWVYPTAYYNNKAEAEAGALSPMPEGLSLAPKLTTVIYQQGDTDFTNAEWQDVRPGISEESFNIITNVGDLAGLSDDNFPQYLLTDGSRVPTGNFNWGEFNHTNITYLQGAIGNFSTLYVGDANVSGILSDLSDNVYLKNNTDGGYNISINSNLPITTTDTVQAEHLYSTNDAEIEDYLQVNDRFAVGNSAYELTGTQGVLNLADNFPTLRVDCIRESTGGLAFSFFDLYATRLPEGSQAKIGSLGILGHFTDPPTPKYLFMGATSTTAYDNAFVKIDAESKMALGLSGGDRPTTAMLEVYGDIYSTGSLTAVDGTFSGTGHFGGVLDTDSNLVVNGDAAIGKAIDTNVKLDIYDQSTTAGTHYGLKVVESVGYWGAGRHAVGFYAEAENYRYGGGGSVTGIKGVGKYSDNIGGAQTLPLAYGVIGQIIVDTAHDDDTITDAYAFYAEGTNVVAGNTITNYYGLYIADSTSTITNEYGIYDDSGADWVLDGDNQKIIFGEGQDREDYWDGTNAIINTTTGNLIILNNTGNGTIEVGQIIDHTPTFSSIDFFERLVLKDDIVGKDNKVVRFIEEKTNTSRTDLSRPVNESYQEEVCSVDEKTQEEVCNNETMYRIIYPYKVWVEGRDVGKGIDVNRIMISELKAENQAKDIEIQMLNNTIQDLLLRIINLEEWKLRLN